VIISFMKGVPPMLTVEFGRRAIPGHVASEFSGMREIHQE